MVLSGTVQPQVQTPFGFRVIGRMIARPVKAGDRVEKGQTLAAIDPLSLRNGDALGRRPILPAPARNSTTPPRPRARQAALLEKKTTSQAAFDTVEQERAAAQANMAAGRGQSRQGEGTALLCAC